jgi:hypothetical protein
MSAEKETLGRVQNGLFHLQRGLTPFVSARMKVVHGDRSLHYANRAQGSSPSSPLDAYGLIKTMIDRWRDVFDEAFPRNEKHWVRNFVSTALEARNATSHLSIPLQDDEALRYLDAMHQLQTGQTVWNVANAVCWRGCRCRRLPGQSCSRACAADPPGRDRPKE